MLHSIRAEPAVIVIFGGSSDLTKCERVSSLVWRFNHKLRSLPPGKILRIETMAPAVIHWTAEDWKTGHDLKTHDAGLGIHLADLPTESLPAGKQIKFTFYWPDAGHWDGKDFTGRIAAWRGDGAAPAKGSRANGE